MPYAVPPETAILKVCYRRLPTIKSRHEEKVKGPSFKELETETAQRKDIVTCKRAKSFIPNTGYITYYLY